MIKKFALIFSTIIFTPQVVKASPCSNYERDKAYHYAEIAGKKLVSEWGGGVNVNTKLVECELNSYSENFRLRVDITWNGTLIESNFYNSEGTLAFDSNGQDAKYTETYANTLWKEFKKTRSFWTNVFEIGALVSENSGSSSEGFRVRVENNCADDVDVAIRYMNLSDNWVFAKWYSIDAKERIYLNHNSSQMRTDTSEIYSYAETKSGEPWDTGEHKFVSEGREFKMKKTLDKEGVTDIILCEY